MLYKHIKAVPDTGGEYIYLCLVRLRRTITFYEKLYFYSTTFQIEIQMIWSDNKICFIY